MKHHSIIVTVKNSGLKKRNNLLYLNNMRPTGIYTLNRLRGKKSNIVFGKPLTEEDQLQLDKFNERVISVYDEFASNNDNNIWQPSL